ncbi:hypothetical protein Tco_0091195 [Tanacetum coccineum]
MDDTICEYLAKEILPEELKRRPIADHAAACVRDTPSKTTSKEKYMEGFIVQTCIRALELWLPKVSLVRTGILLATMAYDARN